MINHRFWVNYLITDTPIRHYKNYQIDLVFGSFIVFMGIFLDQVIRRSEKWDVIEQLWKLLVVGMAGVTLTFSSEIVEQSMSDHVLHPHIVPVCAAISLFALLFFSWSGIFVFQKLLLYQKNKFKVFLWRAMLVILALSFVRLFLRDHFFGTQILQFILIPAFFIVCLFLSANVNWSAYLNFSQKLRSVLLLFLILLIFGALFYANFVYFGQFLVGVSFDESFDPFLPTVVPDFPDIFISRFQIIGFLFIFPLIYALFSGLVLLFNLPTSSVFEQRSSELASIQRITHSIQTTLDTDSIFKTLLDASMLSSNATGGWVEVIDHVNGGVSQVRYYKNATLRDIEALHLSEKIIPGDDDNKVYLHVRKLKGQGVFRRGNIRFGSLVAIKIESRDRIVAVVYVVSDLPGSFEEETILTLVAFAEQAGIALENAELLQQSIGFERYAEQIKIAKEVQEWILPKSLPGGDRIEFFVVNQEVEEIGGDFYDVQKKNGEKFKVALGDVSGKGTTAAFYMAEAKGIFQSLTQLEISARDFIIHANSAVNGCFAPGSFMTLTYLEIDLTLRKVMLMRAGHCPTIYYDSSEDKLDVLERGGPGLGILRDGSFGKYTLEPQVLNADAGDLLILFTDGIMEARNSNGEEFGVSRMRDYIFRLRKTDPAIIGETLLEEAKKFSGGMLMDDYTILVIRFL